MMSGKNRWAVFQLESRETRSRKAAKDLGLSPIGSSEPSKNCKAGANVLPRVFSGIESCLVSSCHKREHSFLKPRYTHTKPSVGEKQVSSIAGALRTRSRAWVEAEGPASTLTPQASRTELFSFWEYNLTHDTSK